MPPVQLNIDVALGVAIPARNTRGRLARLSQVIDESCQPPLSAAVERLLAEALVLTALFGSLLKEKEGQVTIQAQTENGASSCWCAIIAVGIARLCPLRCATAGGCRAQSVARDPVRQGLSGHHLRSSGDEERYQGIVPLEGENLGQAAQSFSRNPSRSRASSGSRPRSATAAGSRGGLLFQHLPEGEEGRERLHTRLDHPEWPHIAILGRIGEGEELTNPELPLDDLIWRLFHEEDEVRTLDAIPLQRGCRCDPTMCARCIARFPAEERQEMVGDDGFIRVDCEFCSSSFAIAPGELD